MSLEFRRFSYPEDGEETPDCTIELKRNRLTQSLQYQKYWIALVSVKPELAIKLSDSYQAQMRAAIAHAENGSEPEPELDATAIITLSPEENLHLLTFPLAINFCRLASVMDSVSGPGAPPVKRWSPSMPGEELEALFDWFTSDPDRYDYIVAQLDGLFSPNGPVGKPPNAVTEGDSRADPNLIRADGSGGAS